MSPRLARSDFERLVDRHHGTVYTAAWRIVGNDADAADVTQQVFLEVLEGRLRLEEAADAGAVLRWLAAKASLSNLRSDGRRRRREEAEAMKRSETIHEDDAEGREERRRLWAAVAELPEELRRAVVLRFQEEQTFEQMGSAMAVSPPAAHDRVRRALARLREAFGGMGVATAAPEIESLLAAKVAVAVPGTLRTRLVALGGKGLLATPAAAAVAILVVGAAALVIAGPGWWRPAHGAGAGAARPPATTGPAGVAWAEPESGSGSGETPVVTRPFREPGVDPVPPSSPGPPSGENASPQAGEAVVTGSVVDATGRGVGSVLVIAASLEREGKMARYAARARSDDAGGFKLVVQVGDRGEQGYGITFQHDDFAEARSPEFVVKAGERRELAPQSLAGHAAERPAPFRLSVRVLDALDVPVAGAVVLLHRRLGPADAPEFRRESGMLTDAAGWAVLEGTHLGRKRLVVEAQRLGHQDRNEDFDLDREGASERLVHLARGDVISGTFATVDGTKVENGQIHARSPGVNEWIFAEYQPGGRFRIPGLRPGTYEVRSSFGEWSAFTLRGVPAGTDDLRILLKRWDDPRDVGTHDAELHGRLVDGATGLQVPADVFMFDVEEVPTADVAELRRDLLPSLVPERNCQRSAQVVASEDRGFHLVGHGAGNFIVVARVRGYSPALAGPFTLTERQVRAGIDIPLLRGATLEGRVVDGGGTPVPGAHVLLAWRGARGDKRLDEADLEIRRTGGRGTHLFSAEACADAEGRYRIGNVPAGLGIGLSAVHPDFGRAEFVPLEFGDGARVEGTEVRLGTPR